MKSYTILLLAAILFAVTLIVVSANEHSEERLLEKGYDFEFLSEINPVYVEGKALFFQDIVFYNRKENIAHTTKLELIFQPSDNTFWYIVPPRGFKVISTRPREAARIYLRDNKIK